MCILWASDHLTSINNIYLSEPSFSKVFTVTSDPPDLFMGMPTRQTEGEGNLLLLQWLPCRFPFFQVSPAGRFKSLHQLFEGASLPERKRNRLSLLLKQWLEKQVRTFSPALVSYLFLLLAFQSLGLSIFKITLWIGPQVVHDFSQKLKSDLASQGHFLFFLRAKDFHMICSLQWDFFFYRSCLLNLSKTQPPNLLSSFGNPTLSHMKHSILAEEWR